MIDTKSGGTLPTHSGTGRFGTDPWILTEDRLDPAQLPATETLFSIGNGYLGIRAAFEERKPVYHAGTYINGFYETKPIIYGEHAYGFARNRQTMLNVTDGTVIELWIDDDPFDLTTGTIHRYSRSLEMRSGLLRREVEWESPSGKRIRLEVKRLVSFTRMNLAAFSWRCETVGRDAVLTIVSSLDGGIRNLVGFEDPRVGSSFKEQVLLLQNRRVEDGFASLRHITRNSRMSLVCGMRNTLNTGCRYAVRSGQGNQDVSTRYTVWAGPDCPVELSKYVSYYTSRDARPSQLQLLSRIGVEEASADGFARLEEEQRLVMDEFWTNSHVEIDGDPLLEQSLRFNLFQILQGTGRTGTTSIAAKGLSGEGYDGHYFWDGETYVLPIYVYTHPELARKLLEYRFNTLPQARDRAKVLGHRGALYPWRTIGGEEASAFFPAGTAQYHINADIIYALRKYVDATGDRMFLVRYGAEMLFETARFWRDLGAYIPGKGFCWHVVTGPDEYSAMVDNNVYTNMMARHHLQFAAETARWLREEIPDAYRQLAGKIELADEEVEEWRRAAERVYIPFNRKLGIYPQDDTFLDKPHWDFSKSGRDKHPLLLHFHPLVLYRHQICKQPDLVLAQFFLGDRFSMAEKKRNFDYYDPLITGDSSLAPCVQSIVSAEIGYVDHAYQYFMKTARMDLDNINGNVKDGVHIAAMAGTWVALVYGFGGMRDYGGKLSFHPVLPKSWRRIAFRVRVQESQLQVEVDRKAVTYTLVAGDRLVFRHQREDLVLEQGGSVRRNLAPKLEAVIMDLEGVIIDTAEYRYRAWKRLSEEQGLRFDRGFNERLRDVGRMRSLELILDNSETDREDGDKSALVARQDSIYTEYLKGLTAEDVLPGALPFLTELKQRGIRTALSSKSRNALLIVDRLQVAEYFDVIVDPREVLMYKPDPETYFKAADLLNVPYGNCAGIDDSEVGIAAINAANMFSLGIGRHLEDADLAIGDTAELSVETLMRIFSRKSEPPPPQEEIR